MIEKQEGDESEGETYRLAVKVASDVTPFGLALGEMLRTLDNMDKRLAAACGANGHSQSEDGAGEEAEPAAASEAGQQDQALSGQAD